MSDLRPSKNQDEGGARHTDMPPHFEFGEIFFRGLDEILLQYLQPLIWDL